MVNTPSIYRCSVMHRRLFPTAYRFRYAVFSLLLDVERIDEAARQIPILSRNRFNLVSFHDRDHGARDGTPLKPWADALLARHAVAGGCNRLLLLSMPRVLGFAFNPLSLFYCYRDEQLVAIIAEVKNTFGEQYCYVLHERGQPLRCPVVQTHAKRFHVSPFMAIDGSYDFRLSEPRDEVSIGINHHNARGVQLVAVQRGQRRDATTLNLIGVLSRMPLMTFKVITMIHWWALKIWLTRTPLFHKPPAPVEESS